MPQLGNYTYADSTDPIAADTAAVGSHAFTATDNTADPCVQGIADCSDCSASSSSTTNG